MLQTFREICREIQDDVLWEAVTSWTHDIGKLQQAFRIYKKCSIVIMNLTEELKDLQGLSDMKERAIVIKQRRHFKKRLDQMQKYIETYHDKID